VEGEKPHPARKENSKEGEHSELPRDSPGEYSSLSSPHQSSPSHLYCVKTLNTNNYMHRRQMGKLAASLKAASATTGNLENRSVSTGSQFV
jgi:hypothetical protein